MAAHDGTAGAHERGGTARRAGLAALAAGAATGAAWALERRLVARAVVAPGDFEAAGLTLPEGPGGVCHHEITVDDGGVVHAVERGSGPPVVLLHGACLSAATWANQLRDLAGDHRVVAVDLRGHGRSVPGRDGFGLPSPLPSSLISPATPRRARPRRPARPRPTALERMALDTAAVLEALDIERALLVGHSLGGMVAIRTAHDLRGREPRRLAGLALVGTSAGPYLTLPGWDLFAALLAPAAVRGVRFSDRLRHGAVPAGDLRYWAARIGFGAEAPPVQVRFVESMLAEVRADTLAGVLESLARVDLNAALEDIDLPVLVVVGTHDRLTPARHARALCGRLPDARLFELARCGHMPMLERRGEFARLLDEHAAKVA